MLEHFPLDAPLEHFNSGSVGTTAHWERDNESLLPIVESESHLSGWNLAADYFFDFFDSYSFAVDTYRPYVEAQQTINPDYDAKTDPNLPSPTQSQGKAVIDKYEDSAGLNNWALRTSDNEFLAGINAELQPYWERMLIHTVIQEKASDADRETLDRKYMIDGINSVSEILKNSEYTASIEVQFAYAQSAAFLRLTEDQKSQFITMSLSDQWDLIYVSAADVGSYIANAEKPYAYEATVTGPYLKLKLIDDKTADFVSTSLDKFSNFQDTSGRNFEAEFNEVFQQQTQTMDFSSIADELKGVLQLYQGVLGRTPDKAGFEYWLKEINSGYTLEELAEGFVNSAEFQSKVGTSDSEVTFDQTLTALYGTDLEREPDTEGYAWWKDKYDNEDYTLGSVTTGFTWSSEFESKVDEHTTAWLAQHYGANLTQMDLSSLGFDQSEIEAIKPIGNYDIDANNGYAGIQL